MLVLVVSFGNFLLGFGLATQLGYGPDWSWLKAKPKPAEHAAGPEKHHS